MNLYQLAFTCYIYDSFTTFNKTYKYFIKAVENKIDLSNKEHRKELILWLNKWGCRQFSIEFHKVASHELLEWYKKGYADVIPQDKKLWELSQSELEGISRAYDELAKGKVSYKFRKGKELAITVGATGASKILFALRPEIAVPWDEAIRKGLGHSGDGNSYLDYLKQVKGKIKSLELFCSINNIDVLEVPQQLGRDGSTLPQLIGEYYWVTLTRKCKPPSDETVQKWARWSQAPESFKSHEIRKVKAFVGGFLGRSFGVEIDVEGSNAEYTVLDYGYELLWEETINLPPKKVEEFLKLLDKLKVFEWKRRYEDPGVIDGTNWSVEIICKEKKYDFTGTNAYPDTWESFCEAVEKILGKDFR